MSSHTQNEENNPVAKLTKQPVRGILKSSKSVDYGTIKTCTDMNNYSASGMTRSESKSQKIPHFDEMNIIATYHPIDKEYGHMKIEEPKTPYAPENNIEEDMDTEDITSPGVDPDAVARKLFETSGSFHISRRSIDESIVSSPDDEEHRKEFESHRKKHYNEYETARLHKKEVEDELRALEQEETTTGGKEINSKESIKPILVRDHSSHQHQQQHVKVEDDDQYEIDNQSLTPEERERRKQFELKRKNHYNEFRMAHSANNEDES